ncbi:MAG TPA: hypothetical protein VG993_07030 [Actinomycetota bacterium]|nr:hypothetical protein [Actinomycetota bacterium]
MKRGFWVALGLGAGATGAILASRWTRKQAQRVAPQTLAREAKGGLMDLSKLVSESIQEGKRAMDERESELRRDAGLTDPAAAPDDRRTGAA